MHIVMLVVFGLIALAVFYIGTSLFQRNGQAGAAVFIWIWLAAAIVNGVVGVLRAGIPVLNEVAAFVPIFGIPAVAAWYLAYRYAPGG